MNPIRTRVPTGALAVGSSMFVIACADGPVAPTTRDLSRRVPTTPEERTGTIQIVQGGAGHGTITSRPAGINCTIGPDGPTGTCEATFPAGVGG